MLSWDGMFSRQAMCQSSYFSVSVPDMLIKSSADMATPAHPCSIRADSSTLSRPSPWLAPLMYALGEKIVLPVYFSRIEVTGQENIPLSGPVVLAPTHQSRWDSLLVGLVGKRAGRYLRFMVTADECQGIQGWLIRRMGGFPVHVRQPSVKSLRHGVQLLQEKEMLVIYPEGNIYRDRINPLKPGLARIALRAERSRSNLNVSIVPISLEYSKQCPQWRGWVKIRIGSPLSALDYKSGDRKQQSQQLTADLQQRLMALANE